MDIITPSAFQGSAILGPPGVRPTVPQLRGMPFGLGTRVGRLCPLSAPPCCLGDCRGHGQYPGLGFARGVGGHCSVRDLPPPPREQSQSASRTLGESQAWDAQGALGPTSVPAVASPWDGALTRRGSLILPDHPCDIFLVKPLCPHLPSEGGALATPHTRLCLSCSFLFCVSLSLST